MSSASTCLFCRIGAGEIPSHTIYEDEGLRAFLDIAPIRPGHAQIIPRQHFAFFEDLPPSLASQILELGQQIARAQKKTYGVSRVAFFFTGTDIAHAHAHLVPMVEPTDVTSRRYFVEEHITFRPAPRAEDSDLLEIAARLRSALEISIG